MDQQKSTTPVTSGVAGKIEGPVNLFKGALNFYKLHWKVLTLFFAIPSIVAGIAEIIGFGDNPVLAIAAMVLVIIGLILGIVQLVSSISFIDKLHSGASINSNVLRLYKAGFVFIGPLIIVAVISFFATFGGLILLVIPVIMICLYANFSLYALVIDGKRGFSAIEESYSIINERIWDVLVRSLFIAIVTGVIGLIIVGVHFIIGLLLGIENPLGLVARGHELQPLFSRSLLSAIFDIIAAGVVTPISALFMYSMFISAKATRSPSVSTKSFKKVIIGCMVIGIIVTVGILVLIPSVASQMYRGIQKGALPSSTSVGASLLDSGILQN